MGGRAVVPTNPLLTFESATGVEPLPDSANAAPYCFIIVIDADHNAVLSGNTLPASAPSQYLHNLHFRNSISPTLTCPKACRGTLARPTYTAETEIGSKGLKNSVYAIATASELS